MSEVGMHIIIDLFGCNSSLADDINYIKDTLYKLVEILPAKVCKDVFHKFKPLGVSGAIIISSSHLTVHTWPEHNYIGVDIFTCSGECDYRAVVDFLCKQFGSTNYILKKLKRGDQSESCD